MNYLGHIFLSGKKDQVILGNFIGDYVKGKQYQNYPELVAKGIRLHRTIDHFTDKHPDWKKIREFFRPSYNRYAGVVADLVVDHFLSKNWNTFSDEKLSWVTKKFHATLLQNYSILPQRVKGFLPFLIQHKRLVSYASLTGIEEALYIMSLRRNLPKNQKQAIQTIESNNKQLKALSIHFIEKAILFSEVERKNFEID